MYFFTSDTHFGSEEILKRENRPFNSMEEFENSIIDIWNSQAEKTDIIYVLGDFVNYNKNHKEKWRESLKLAKRINAKLILILGNNEQRIIDECCSGNFEEFKEICVNSGFFDVKFDDFIEFNDKKFYLNHFPRNFKQNYINLFGHTHRTTGLWKPFGMNMGCDLNHFYLFSQEEIERLLKDKTLYWDSDKDNNLLGKTSSVIENIEQYRDPILAKNILEEDFIGFYPREFFVFDNFSSFGLIMDGEFYPTVEHAYQSGKFVDSAPEIADQIKKCLSAHDAQKIAFANRDRQAPNWDEIKVEYMEKLLRKKLEQNPYVKQKLLQTKDFIICEDSPKDSFWGIGENRDGQNALGKLWMKLREELK